MNYLAHAFLSFQNADLLAGNMICDFVKGNKKFDYPQEIQNGFDLHRAIDLFTDEHQSTNEIKEYFRPKYRLYSGAFADIVYDYFLANDRNQFPEDADLMRFSKESFQLLETKTDWLNKTKFGLMLPKMKAQNWLYNYQFEQGIFDSFEGLRRRAKYISEIDSAFSIFLNNKEKMKHFYSIFFPELKEFAAKFIQNRMQSTDKSHKN